MFSLPKVRVYEGPDGSTVEVLGMTSICYKEAGKEMRIDSEVLLGSRGLRVYAESITRWDSSSANGCLSNNERQRILECIREAFRCKGHDIEIVPLRDAGVEPLKSSNWKDKPVEIATPCRGRFFCLDTAPHRPRASGE